MNNSKRPILVTGSHRSGSTWVGKMIASSNQVGYIWEPFNLLHRPGVCSAKFAYWFQYVNHENGMLYEKSLRDCISFRYGIPRELKAIASIKDIGRLFRDVSLFSLYRARGSRPLLKDPIALFSAEWLADTFNMDVVVLIRHPAAFVGSLKQANWEFPFSHILSQPLLMEQLDMFRPQIEEYSKVRKDIIDQAILLWNMMHSMISRYSRVRPSWLFVRHEDLSRDPINGFKDLFGTLGLEFNKKIECRILEYTSVDNPKGEQHIASIRRDSADNIRSWKKRLSISEIEMIRKHTGQIADRFYSEADW